MRFCYFGKDGGPESNCYGFWLIEIKSLFSIALLKFDGKSREVFHNHAFNSVSWLLSGRLIEWDVFGSGYKHRPSLSPIVTRRHTLHQVQSLGVSWALTFRGPWKEEWKEYDPEKKAWVTLTHGRKEVK